MTDLRLLVGKGTAAEALGVSLRTVETLIARGELPSVLLGGRRLVHTRDLETFAERLRVNAGINVEACGHLLAEADL
ncbi:MAG: helix-turn-helix domain-containing protein [Chloroflexi bacterium]|nr:helix-turn-helix domain-containing protein [Chloroflexota bacterium]